MLSGAGPLQYLLIGRNVEAPGSGGGGWVKKGEHDDARNMASKEIILHLIGA